MKYARIEFARGNYPFIHQFDTLPEAQESLKQMIRDGHVRESDVYLYEVSDKGIEPIKGWEAHGDECSICIGRWEDKNYFDMDTPVETLLRALPDGDDMPEDYTVINVTDKVVQIVKSKKAAHTLAKKWRKADPKAKVVVQRVETLLEGFDD